ncbi:MAG: hypothetical protein NTU81_03675 [Candidatus Nomurabacteria bacterium]|nr:hypothetical protein [Candidatus Nomurabacteria bacterium]
MKKNQVIPNTKTPTVVYLILLMIILIFGTIFYSLFGIWGIIIFFIILAYFTSLFLEDDIPMFHALIMRGGTGKMRVLFPGVFNFKLPWEQAHEENGAKKYIDLRVETGEICNDTYPSKDTLMKTQYVYSLRPDLRKSNNGTIEENIIKFSSFEISAIREKAKALFSMLLSDWYANKSGDDLKNKSLINKKLFGTKDKPSNAVTEFEKEHGVEISVRLVDSDFNDNVQEYRDKIAGAKTINEIRNILMKDDIHEDGTVAKGVSPEVADQMIKFMEFGNYSEKVVNLNIKAPDLGNLQNVNLLGGTGITGDEKKEGKK